MVGEFAVRRAMRRENTSANFHLEGLVCALDESRAAAM
jgi:hypothetical protein